MKKCFVVYLVSIFPKSNNSAHMLNGITMGITETKEDARTIARSFNVPIDIFPKDYHIYALLVDYPFGEMVGQRYGADAECYRYSENGMTRIDLEDEDSEVADIYLKYFPNQS